MTEKITEFSKEGKEAIRQIVKKELENVERRLSRLEHKIFGLKAVPSKKVVFHCPRCGAIFPKPSDMYCVFCQREGLKRTKKIKLINLGVKNAKK